MTQETQGKTVTLEGTMDKTVTLRGVMDKTVTLEGSADGFTPGDYGDYSYDFSDKLNSFYLGTL